MASADNARAYCTSCGTELVRAANAGAAPAAPIPAALAPAEPDRKLRDPRELLARWAREDALERIEIGSPAGRGTPAERPAAALRFDGSHPVLPAAPAALTDHLPRTAHVPAPEKVAAHAAEAPHALSQDVVVHQAHEPNPPHFTAVPVSLADRSTRWVTLTGQIFAYLGVGGLTIGTSLVLTGYFGGPAGYATTGWLIATAGQMLLFLGVVTLVSGGMEQTTQEVVRRIDTLGERLVKIEQAAFTGKSQAPSQSQRVETKK
ncbi:MAG: hypothetical protein HY290_20820 [Planctomycetia bacterium]|nr:hypothetical protein [Planctomycetia bacterium]